MYIKAKNIGEIVKPSLKTRVTSLIYGFGGFFSPLRFYFLSFFPSPSLTSLLLHLSKLLFCSAYFKHYRKI